VSPKEIDLSLMMLDGLGLIVIPKGGQIFASFLSL